MKNETELSPLGWIIFIGISAGVFYWFSQLITDEPSVANGLNLLVKSLIFIVLFIIEICAICKKKFRWFIISNMVTLILAFDTIIFNWNNTALDVLSDSEYTVPELYIVLPVDFGFISAVFMLVSIGIYINKLMDPESGELQAIKTLLTQNSVTKLMFKPSKQEKPTKKVKM